MRLLPALLFAAILWAQTEPAQDLLDRGIALARENRFDEAARVLEEGRRRFPLDHRFALELAGVKYRENDHPRARSYLREALRQEPADRYGNEFLASLYMLDGNVPAALKYWNRVSRPIIADVCFSPVPALDPVLRERIPAVSGGQLLTLGRFERTRTNLERLRIFSDYRVELTPGRGDRYDVTIRTVPRSTASGAWWWRVLPFVRGLPYEQVNIDFYNLRRSSTNFESLWRWDSNKRRVAISLSGPAGMSRYRVGVDARDEQWDLRRTDFAADPLANLGLRRIEAGAEWTFYLGDNAQWTPGFWTSHRHYRRADATGYFAGGWLAEMRNRFDAVLFNSPDRRLRVNGWGMLRSGRFLTGGQRRFVSPQAGVLLHWFPKPSGEKYEVNTEFRAGGAFGRVPFDEMFTLGMERDNDLWLRGHVGTRDGRKGSAPLGSRYLLWNISLHREVLRIPFVRVQAGPFFDLGTVGDPRGRFGSRGVLYDTGLQLKLATVGGVSLTAVYGRDLRNGRGVFYTAVSR